MKINFPNRCDGMPQLILIKIESTRRQISYSKDRFKMHHPKRFKLIGEAVRRIKENRPKRQKN